MRLSGPRKRVGQSDQQPPCRTLFRMFAGPQKPAPSAIRPARPDRSHHLPSPDPRLALTAPDFATHLHLHLHSPPAAVLPALRACNTVSTTFPPPPPLPPAKRHSAGLSIYCHRKSSELVRRLLLGLPAVLALPGPTELRKTVSWTRLTGACCLYTAISCAPAAMVSTQQSKDGDIHICTTAQASKVCTFPRFVAGGHKTKYAAFDTLVRGARRS